MVKKRNNLRHNKQVRMLIPVWLSSSEVAMDFGLSLDIWVGISWMEKKKILN